MKTDPKCWNGKCGRFVQPPIPERYGPLLCSDCERIKETMNIYTVDVAYSDHDLLKEGITESGFRRFRVLAPDGNTATLIAAQWVAADRITDGTIPTRTMLHI
jgi:hypothetical protein